MPFRSGIMAREMGAALAVLALYILVLLGPLHQAAGLQRDLTRLGYASQANWSICAPPTTLDTDPDQPIIIKCAAAGLGNAALPPPLPGAMLLAPLLLSSTVAYPSTPIQMAPALPRHRGESRAPPASV